MELSRVKGLKPAVAAKLKRAGIRNAEDLALVDLRRARVEGITRSQLTRLRQNAQRSIFQDALRRVQKAADDAFETIEGAVQEATWATLDAAKLAQRRARETMHAARGRARVLARVAASKTRDAARSAEKEYQKLLREFRRAPPRGRKDLITYKTRAERATAAAKKASVSAVEAAKQANRLWQLELRAARLRSVRFVDRVKDAIRRDNGARHYR